ncbi:putative RNA-directed DNA polymerase, eukaryota, reverse transcriptase zinc-binding domain protein [Tanacetum coccineum]|uniref:RNA-directed DNA polymerase, eukaryota, reverse transcriptase zinc-binding domain protein n=1 Tax=Tanacetum coccineum TaxID=301880 RepID=A0ABQ5CIN0_9ASTR
MVWPRPKGLVCLLYVICKVKDLRQKDKTMWAIEGDENSRFFHGIINSNRNHSRINGLSIQGVWVMELTLIKTHIFNAFKAKFHEDVLSRPSFSSNHFRQLSYEDFNFLDQPFISQEIKDADLVVVKKLPIRMDSLSRFSRSIGAKRDLARRFFFPILYILAIEALNVVLIEAKSKELFRGVEVGKDKIDVLHFQFADDAFIMGEWSKQNIKNLSRIHTCFYLASGLKVNFSKSEIFGVGVNNKELNTIATSIGYQPCQFPCTYLVLALTTVFIDGSPSPEFKLEKGLWQGDSFPPILYILAIEALNVVLIEAESKELFRGVEVGKDKIDVSHLQFADDAFIMGEWSKQNIKNLSRIHTSFYLASGLKVNFSKSEIFGVGVNNQELNTIATSIGYQPC